MTLISLKCILILQICFSAFLHAKSAYMAKIVSDYVFEGISQSNNKAAFQGYLEYATENGFYLHTWASNVDFGEDLNGIEIDIYLGYVKELNEVLTLDTGYVNYFYAADNDNLKDYEYAEIFANLTIYDNSTVYFWLAEDEAVGGHSRRFKITHSFPLINDYNLNIAFHAWKSQRPIWNIDENEANGRKSYHNYLIGLSKEFNDFLVSLAYSDTNMNNWEEAGSNIILTISRTFE
jgi:uncharacterized protein (TIGR02001 family)